MAGTDAKQNRCRQTGNFRAAYATGQSSSDGTARVTTSLRAVAQTARGRTLPAHQRLFVCAFWQKLLRKSFFFQPVGTSTFLQRNAAKSHHHIGYRHPPRDDLRSSVIRSPIRQRVRCRPAQDASKSTKAPTNRKVIEIWEFQERSGCFLIRSFWGYAGFFPLQSRGGWNAQHKEVTTVQEAEGITTDNRRPHSRPLSPISLSSIDLGRAQSVR